MWWPSFQDVRSFKSFCPIKLSKLSFRFDNFEFGQWFFFEKASLDSPPPTLKIEKNVAQRLKGLETFSLLCFAPKDPPKT